MPTNTSFIVTVLIGVFGGLLSGLIGIGGGIIVIPALVFFLGMSQHMAQGTTLAMMIPPIGLFAALAYYQKGFVDIRVAVILCIAFVVGSIFGAKFALSIPQEFLKRVFGIALLFAGARMLISK